MLIRQWPSAVNCALLSITLIHPASTHAQPPATRKQPVVDTYHGIQVSDSYRWLEDDQSEEVKKWSNAQNVNARSILDKLPGGAAIRARVTEIMTKRPPSYSNVQLRGGKYFAM